MENYDDIISLPHPEPDPVRHPRMSLLARAAQFAPFAALTGYDDAIGEAGRLTDSRRELEEYDLGRLDRRLAALRPRLPRAVTVVHFQPDERKEGGSYLTLTAPLRLIDDSSRELVFADGRRIGLDNVLALEEAHPSEEAEN